MSDSRNNWCSPKELMAREYGNMSSKVFETRNYSALNTVQRLELMAKLEKHQSCVNCLNFNRTGEFLLSGSDDLKIVSSVNFRLLLGAVGNSFIIPDSLEVVHRSSCQTVEKSTHKEHLSDKIHRREYKTFQNYFSQC